ncbi:MAG: ABC transporter permease [Alphaproteobacteria bacterium]
MSIRTNGMLSIGLVIVGALALLAALAPWLTPYQPSAIDLQQILQAPSPAHWLGTDAIGRDVFTRMLYGARVSLLVGLVAVGLSTAIGVLLGAVAGYYGGKTDALIMRGVDVMLAFPSFFLILAVIAFLEPSIINIMVVIGLTSWMGVARLVRAEFLRLKTMDYIAAARLAGVSDGNLMLKHLLPNAMAPILVTATLGIAGAVLVESGLSFLGIGVQPPTPSWGNILLEGKANIEIAWWLSLFPGLAILIAVLGFNLLGEGLRDYLDPRQR